jgi:hypothetical protein
MKMICDEMLSSVAFHFNLRLYTRAIPPLACLYMSKQAIRNSDWSSYVLWHTLWHIAAVSLSSYVMWLAGSYTLPLFGLM